MKKWLKVLLITLWSLFLFGIVVVVVLFAMIANGRIGYMPPIEDMQIPLISMLHS